MRGMPQCPKCGKTVFESTQMQVTGAPGPMLALYCRDCMTVINIVPLAAFTSKQD